MDAKVLPATRREAAKAERRRRIVEAAAALAREAGFDSVSMLQIAERAEVSPATLYNLFQTKGAIFQQVFDRDLEEFLNRLAEAPAVDALDRIFAAVELAASLYAHDPAFYRAMSTADRQATEGAGVAIRGPRIVFWQVQVATAVAEGLLRPETDTNLLGVTLSQFLRGAFPDWAANLITAERMALETTYGIALALLAYATDETAPSLRARIEALQPILAPGSRVAKRG
jgi:AcrR family transcriptional regulator